MKQIIKMLDEAVMICGSDFTKWPNNAAADALKVIYKMLKELKQEAKKDGNI